MSVSYLMSVGYGLIVDEEEAETMKEYVMEKFSANKADIFIEEYLTPINAWTGDDYFLGITKDLGYSDRVKIDNNLCDTRAVIKFLHMITEYEIIQFLSKKDEPEFYLLNFCYQGLTNSKLSDIIKKKRKEKQNGSFKKNGKRISEK